MLGALLMFDVLTRYNAQVQSSNPMWDTKRQVIWLVAGISFGTFIIFTDAHDELGRFEPWVFVFWEIVLLVIIATLFYLYSRKKT